MVSDASVLADIAWHARSGADSVAALATSESGLDEEDALARLLRDGANDLPIEQRRSALRVVLSQFRDPLVIVLLAAAALSFTATGEVLDAVIILALVLVNAAIGSAQELSARRSLDALRATLSPDAVVMRQGAVRRIPAADLVRGDIVLLSQGDRIPADLRLLEASALAVDESALTGESIPAEKSVDPVDPALEPADWTSVCFSSTFVTRGRGVGVVIATGSSTEIGRIAGTLMRGSDEITPLQRQLSRLGIVAGVGVGAISIALFLVGVAQGRDLLSTALLAVSLAVAAIPEGLVAISAIILAGGVRRMAHHGAIVRTLASVETIGSASVICVDKTGTLTENRMKVVSSWEPGATDQPSQRLLQVAALCNDAPWALDSRSSAESSAGSRALGDPMEVALARWVEDAGVSRLALDGRLPRTSEVPFDSTRKLMTTVHATSAGVLVATKGGVEELLARCVGVAGTAAEQEIALANERLAAQGLRVLAFADKTTTAEDTAWEQRLEFVGLVGLEDPPRDHVSRTIERCLDAGVTTVMITGDHAITALAIASRIGLLSDGRRAITGRELAAIPDAEFRSRVHEFAVYARSTPESKVRIVDAWRARGAIVAMTGDGVNDGPALRAADVGCAMGKMGTDVARAAADVIITDDDFATIVDAIEEGRRTHDNLAKAVAFLLSTNIGEVVLLVIAVVAGLAAPLTPVHILIINLITDGAPALALAADPPESNAMRRPPLPATLLTKRAWIRIASQGMLFGLTALAAFLIAGGGDNLATAQTMTFVALALSQVIHSFSVSSARESVLSRRRTGNVSLVLAGSLSAAFILAVLYVPFLGDILGLVALTSAEVGMSIGLAVFTLAVVEIAKLLSRRLWP